MPDLKHVSRVDGDEMLQSKKEKKKREKKQKEVIQILGADQDSQQPSFFEELEREVGTTQSSVADVPSDAS